MKNSWWRIYVPMRNDFKPLPWYMGYAWPIHVVRVNVFMIIPLNIIAAKVQMWWFRMANGIDSRIDDAYASGFSDGCKMVHDENRRLDKAFLRRHPELSHQDSRTD